MRHHSLNIIVKVENIDFTIHKNEENMRKKKDITQIIVVFIGACKISRSQDQQTLYYILEKELSYKIFSAQSWLVLR